ncbi:MAG: hypothetical protein RLZZ126_308 [Pseudomonadota bacterium]|jgi:sulfate permease, SulP family
MFKRAASRRLSSFRPYLLESLRDYTVPRLLKDLGAGTTVAIVALPLAMAFAMASGLKPETGLFTAIIAGFLVSALGGSRVQIGGPAGAFIVIVYGIVERYGLANLIIATAMSGVILFLMGLLKLGVLIRFVPVAVVIGFTNGIAVLVAVSQIKDFLGLRIDKMPSHFFGIVSSVGNHLNTVNWHALGLAVVALALIVGWQAAPRWIGPSSVWSTRLAQMPGSIIALAGGTMAVALLGLEVDTIGSRFGGIPSSLPGLVWPSFSWETVRFLIVPASTLAMLGAIESLLCARIADTHTGDRHNPDQELMAQGIANIVTPFFGGMPATGTIARTMTNIKSGATSPVAGMAHAAILLIVVVVAAPLARHVPLAVLAAILMFVAWNMGEWREFARLRQYRLPYRITLLAVFLLTVILDLTVAVEVGLVAACLTFIYRISSLTRCERFELPESETSRGIHAYQLSGALFFGAVKLLENIESGLPARALVLDMSHVIYVDSSGMETLAELAGICRKQGTRLIVCGLAHQPLDIARRTGLLQQLGLDESAVPDLAAALLLAA